MDRFIETEILFYNVKNENLGLQNTDRFERALIDLNTIYGFAVYIDKPTCTQLYNEYIECICVINMSFDKFKPIFLAYKNSLMNVLSN